jgi:hypothetical protein
MTKESGSFLFLAILVSFGLTYLLIPSDRAASPALTIAQPRSGAAPAAVSADAPTSLPTPSWRSVMPKIFETQSAPVVVTLKEASTPSQVIGLPQPPTATPLPTDRNMLARELQRELRRVGCYEGELNGAWTSSTRRAMQAFIDRANAALPVDEPDQVLLALVQAHKTKACGADCPPRQALNPEGRCVPIAIMAQRGKGGRQVSANARREPVKEPTPAITAWSTTTTQEPAQPSTPYAPDGRMALSGPGAVPAPGDPQAQVGNGPALAVAPPQAQTPASRPARARPQPSRARFGPSVFGRLDRAMP